MNPGNPNYRNFLPLAQQADVIYDVKSHDYSSGLFEFLLSGSVGSSKSLALTHLICDHVLSFPNANIGVGRLALPRLKGTLCEKIREHLYGTGISYKYDESKGSFKFPNGSKITPFSWNDKRYEKFRSYELSAMVFEELSENHDEHKKAYTEAVARVGRLPHVPESWVGSASNPDSPSHWVYKYFMETKRENRKVYYSKTTDNPFLPDWYMNSLLEIYDKKMAMRMIEGRWIEITDEVVYYTYDKEFNYRDESYEVDERYPVYICYDFNIAEGKPLSVAFHQCIDGIYHVFNEVVVHGQRTGDSLVEAKNKGLLDFNTRYIVHGDANGFNRNTVAVDTDYSIIEDFLEDQRLDYEMDIAKSNPKIRDRHNLVNGRICNAKGTRRLFVYKDAPTADEGFRLTSLKKGAQYLENDSPEYQHITTAIGYSLCEIETSRKSPDSYSGMISMRGGRRL